MDSREEEMFFEYLTELKDAGYITEIIYQPESFELSPERCVGASVTKRNDEVDKSIVLAKKHLYTADFDVTWDESAHGLFYWQEGGVYPNNFYPYRKSSHDSFIPFFAQQGSSLIDVKGEFIGRNNTSAITFPINQKWLLSQGVYVQKVVVSLTEKGIFARTFTPQSVVKSEVYKVGDKKGSGKLKYNYISLKEYVCNRK